MSNRKNLLGTLLLAGLMALTGWLLLRDQPPAALLTALRRADPALPAAGVGADADFCGL